MTVWSCARHGSPHKVRRPIKLARRLYSRVLRPTLLGIGWVLFVVERNPSIRYEFSNFQHEASRYLYKRFFEPHCTAPGLQLGSDDNLRNSDELEYLVCNVPRPVDRSTAGNAPRVYIFEHMADLIVPKDPAPPQLCSERDFHRILAANRTGYIVHNRSEANLFYIPYYAGCLSRDILRKEAKSGRLMREYLATLRAIPEWQRYNGADFFSYSQRHFTERVAYGRPIRSLMREVPMIWLVPEITLIQVDEITNPVSAWFMSRIVIVPQPPVISRILKETEKRRHFKFAFVGGIINAERRRLVDGVRNRVDSYIRASCRGQRYDAFDMDLESVYSSADFCIIPSGDAYSSRRTFDALRMGCIPVVTNPLMLLPFADQMDYSSFVVYLDAGQRADIGSQLDAISSKTFHNISTTSSKREAVLKTSKALAMEDCDYAGGVRLAVEAAYARSVPLRSTFTAQPAVKDIGFDSARLLEYKFQW